MTLGMESPESRPHRIVVTLCTYNERENISRLIPAILQVLPTVDVLVVDDSSPDGTAEVASELGKRDRRVKLLLRTAKEGLGAATLAGLNWAIDQNYDFAINMDADFSHPPRFLPQLIGVMNRCDVGIGSRYVPHGGIEGWGINRHLMSRAINLYSQMLLGLKVRDCSGAFRCYRISKLREIDFSKFRARGYAFQEEMLYRCIRIGSRTTEIPIIFENRQTGVSKINVREMYCAVRDIFLLGIDSIRDAPVGFLS